MVKAPPTAHLPLEAAIEQRGIDDIKKRYRGAITRKMNGAGHRDWPDRLILLPGGTMLMIEFKRPGERLRPSQAYWCSLLLSLGVPVFVCDTREAAVAACETMILHSDAFWSACEKAKFRIE